MVVTPNDMPKRRPVAPVALKSAYTTTAGDDRARRERERVAFQALMAAEDDQPYCFVCKRATDHFAEHDDLVEQGLAQYDDDGSVYRTEKWDDLAVEAIVARTFADANAGMFA